MNGNKQYLFTANGSYFGHCLVAAIFLFPVVYGIIDRGFVDYNENNVLMLPLGVALLLLFTSITEACMMIITKGCLFAYNVDKAICVQIKDGDVKSAVSIGRRLYGPVFDSNCEAQFSSSPKSPIMRNCFYSAIILMFFISLISPCYHFINALRAGVWSSNLVVSWFFILFDGTMIVNRLYFRASIRKFWAHTLGDANYRAILRFELSKDDYVRPPFIGISGSDIHQSDC